MLNRLKDTCHLVARRSIAAVLLACGIALIAPEQYAIPTDQASHSASGGADRNGEKDFSVTFVDVAQRARLTSPIIYGGLDRKKYIIETNGCGVAFFDYDNDGWMDILLLNGTRLEEIPKENKPTNKLYHNNRDGSFSDLTAKSGLTGTGWASAVTVGDYDNDGFDDLFITYWGRNVLFHNNGNGTFDDVTSRAGLNTKGIRWGSGCAFIDYDRDGKLDLFVANYLKFDLASAAEPGKGPNCLWKGIPVNCGPKGLPTDTNLLYHNNGDGTFTDVSEASGISKVRERYAMTAIVTDFNDDGWPDLYVACDSTASILYRNNRDGTFTDVAVETGAAYNEDGQAQAGMGVTVGDYNGDGLLDIFKTHFADDLPILYRNTGRGFFEDASREAGFDHTRYVQWGTGLVDFDNDGDIDVLVMNMNEPPSLLRNEYINSTSRGVNNWLKLKLIGTKYWLKLKLIGTKSNRSAIGARVRLRTGAHLQAQEISSQSSYYSHNDPRLHFGLGANTKADQIDIRWPSGAIEVIKDIAANQIVTIKEGSGIVRSPGSGK